LELVYEIREEKLEMFVGFAVEKDRGGESMATAVGGGTGFPFGRDGAVTLQRCSPDNMIELCFRQLEACLVFWEL